MEHYTRVTYWKDFYSFIRPTDHPSDMIMLTQDNHTRLTQSIFRSCAEAVFKHLERYCIKYKKRLPNSHKIHPRICQSYKSHRINVGKKNLWNQSYVQLVSTRSCLEDWTTAIWRNPFLQPRIWSTSNLALELGSCWVKCTSPSNSVSEKFLKKSTALFGFSYSKLSFWWFIQNQQYQTARQLPKHRQIHQDKSLIRLKSKSWFRFSPWIWTVEKCIV